MDRLGVRVEDLVAEAYVDLLTAGRVRGERPHAGAEGSGWCN